MQICNMLCDQYVSGKFKAMELSGKDNNRMYFSEEITPERLKDGADIEVSIVASLPQDDMSKYSMAQIAREGETPLMPDLWIRDNVLGVQDSDQIDDAIKEQIAERSLPEASIWSLYQAALKQGRDDLAQMYFGELVSMLLSKAKMMRDNLGGGGVPPGPSPGQPPMPMAPPPPGGPEGMMPMPPPGVMPPAMAGVPPPMPTPQAGPLVAPGQPRPGAMSPDQRLQNMGLVGPGG